MTAYTPELGDRIAALLAEFKLTSAAEQMTRRFVDAGCDQALVTLAEVLEVEAHARRERRIDRLRRASRLPPAKTFDTLDATRVPRHVLVQIRELARGHFVERAANVLLFGRPGVGKSHLACALGHALVAAGISVLFTPTYQLVQQLLVARRDLNLPRALRALDAFEVMICDDLGYVQQTPDEAEVLFTLMAERYERRSLVITTNQTSYAPSSRKFDGDPGPSYWGASTVGACALDQRTRWPRGGSCCFIKAATVGPWFTQRRRSARNGRRCRRSGSRS